MTPVNILLVDDREENIIALEALLKRDDIKIFSTTSPNDALKIAWENNIAIASGAVDYLYKPLDPYITSAKVDSFVQLARYQAEIIRKNEELENFSIVVNNSADIICAVDAQTLRVKTINPTVEKILGYKPAEIVGKSIIDRAIEHDRIAFRNKLGEIIKDNLSFAVFEFQFETFDKNIIWAECRASYHNKTIFINISNISPQKSYLEQLVKSKDAAEYGKKIKENFLANMSHELRTPINGVIGLTQLLRKTPVNEQQLSMLELLETSSQSLLGVINDVLDISKIESGKFSIVRTANNIREVIASVFQLLKFKADEKMVDMLLDIDPNLPEYMMIDALRLRQILMNLLSNAIKFTDKGYVKLKIYVLNRDKDRLKIKFSIEDTGIGIAEENLLKIFDSFEQADIDTANIYGGTGLGLTIVKRLVELKGGELTVSSQIGKGSVFSIINWLAIAEKPKHPKDDGGSYKKLPPFNQLNILVAEDNVVNQFILSKMLKDWNVNVEMVDNGRKLIEKLHQQNFDIILMDTHMPDMNGYQTAKAIRMDFEEPKRSIPIISLSAAALDHEKEEAISVGMNDVLSKPFQPHELHHKIQEMLKIDLVS